MHHTDESSLYIPLEVKNTQWGPPALAASRMNPKPTRPRGGDAGQDHRDELGQNESGDTGTSFHFCF